MTKPAKIAMIAALVVLPVAAVVSLFLIRQPLPPTPRATAAPQPSPPPAPVATDAERPDLPPGVRDPRIWSAWAVLDRVTGQIEHGGQTGQSTTESMIKVAIGAGYLRDLELAGREPTAREHGLLARMIRVSDNDAATALYEARGGDRMLRRVFARCGLADVKTRPGWWGGTRMTAADGARLGGCIADGMVASPPWAAWLLEQMRQVTGQSRFGWVDARPTDRGRPLAIKNGYTVHEDGKWHVNCLAIADWWAGEIMLRYPADLGLGYGSDMCRRIAAAIIPDDEAAPTLTGASAAPSPR